jgi:hypothetical protein
MVRRPLPLLAALSLVLLLVAGCGGSDKQASAPTPPPQTADVKSFPAATGKTMDQIVAAADAPEGPILAPSVSIVGKGKNRFAFALFDPSRKQIQGAQVAVYVAKGKDGKVYGPFPARSESLKVSPQFESQTTASDPDAAKSVYVAEVPIRSTGRWQIAALTRLDGRLLPTNRVQAEVGKDAGPPAVGEKAPKITTPTVDSVGGAIDKIDTRVPPLASLHDINFADVVGKKPVVLLFATPQLCQSRVCGPVVDVEAEVQSKYKDKADFLHMEIYNDNKLEKGFRRQVGTYRLPSEPWAFVIDRNGVVRDRFEGAFSVGELERAVAKVTSGS